MSEAVIDEIGKPEPTNAELLKKGYDENVAALAAGTKAEGKDETEKKEEDEVVSDKKVEAEPKGDVIRLKGDGKDDQRIKSYEGSMNALKTKHEAAEARNAELMERIDKLEAKSAITAADKDEKAELKEIAITDALMEDPEVLALEKEYGSDFTKVLKKFAGKLSEESAKKTGDLSKTFEEKLTKMTEDFKAKMAELEPIVQSHKDNAETARAKANDEAKATVLKVHPDYQDYVDKTENGEIVEGELSAWITGHEDEAVLKYAALHGSPTSVIKLFTQFKSETGKKSPAETAKIADRSKKDKALDDMSGVTVKKRSPVIVSETSEIENENSLEAGYAMGLKAVNERKGK
jgi:hypothetical protein